jgi:purine nucleoside phosphorylase
MYSRRDKENVTRIAIIGGSGFWSEINHYKNLLLISDVNYQIVAIVDYKSPHKIRQYNTIERQKVSTM